MKKLVLSLLILSSIPAPIRASDKAVETLIDVGGILIASAAAYYGIEYVRACLMKESEILTNGSKAPKTAPANQAASDAWIAQHTKPCPGCGVRIEKNGGCDYMQCPLCKTEFCWLCSKYHNHSNHVCKK